MSPYFCLSFLCVIIYVRKQLHFIHCSSSWHLAQTLYILSNKIKLILAVIWTFPYITLKLSYFTLVLSSVLFFDLYKKLDYYSIS